MIHAASRAIAHIPHLSTFLSGEQEASVGWGRKRSGARAQKLAVKKGLPFLLLEDGFLRSVERDDPPLSLVVDDLGVYYDANQPSRLEKLIAAEGEGAHGERARALIEAWRKARVSKYNHAREYEGPLPVRHHPSRYVLVCDQTYGDASVTHGKADQSSFECMLQAALDENPDVTVLIRTHPDVSARQMRGYFEPAKLARIPRVEIMTEKCHPVRLIEEAEAIYTVTSQMGFEALVWGKHVRCFGMPFYAGWGLTKDDLPAPSRRGQVSLEQLVYATLVGYPRYINPETGERCEVEDLIEHVALQRERRERFDREIYAVGFSSWKQPILRLFLAGSDVCFIRDPSKIPAGATVALWGSDEPESLPTGSVVLRIEDGFIRSVGLGVNRIAPLSWICDDMNIYYSSAQYSRLDKILMETNFSLDVRARARHLRTRILEAGITKYNVGEKTWCRPETAAKVILVPGQVERDASIRLGAPTIKTNMDLLRAVRAADPSAYIVYKRHPDVAAGLRSKGKDEDRVRLWCDEIVSSADMAELLRQVDEVHTLTSLAGFEALLRGRKVTCYGQPFYAGWGLTTDVLPIPHRKRRLSMDELVAGTLIQYPTYISRVTGRFTTPERALEELIAWREIDGVRFDWRRMLRPIFRCAELGREHWTLRRSDRRSARNEVPRGG